MDFLKKGISSFRSPLLSVLDTFSMMDDMFDSFLSLNKRSVSALGKPCFVEKNGQLYFKVDCPGFEKSDLSITVEDRVLSINGEKKNADYESKIFNESSFSQSLILPYHVEPEEIKVTLNGVLHLSIPSSSKKGKEVEIS